MPLQRNLKNWINDFVETVGPKSEAPARFLYWAAVATVSGAIRRRCYIDMGTFSWHPNWYIILVGPPGYVKKSTTIDVATRLLREVEGVVFGSDCTTWENYVTEIAEAHDVFAIGGARDSFYEQEYAQSSAITFAISEFGTFFDPQNKFMVNMMTEFWDGRDVPFKKGTKTQGTDTITAPFVNMIAGTTPKWIADNFSPNFGGWGLSSRIIFLHADKVERYVPYPDEVWGSSIHTWAAPFKQDLASIAQMEGPIRLGEDVREFMRPWYIEHMDRLEAVGRNPHADPWLSYYLQRKWSHVHKLAIVLSVAQGDSYLITPTTMQEAIVKCNEVEDELSLIFRGQKDQDRRRELISDVGAAIISGLWSSGGSCLASKIYRFTYRSMSGRETDDLVSQMVKANFIQKTQRGPDLYLDLLEEGKSILPPEERRRLEDFYGDPLLRTREDHSGVISPLDLLGDRS